jgi:hypothetical protein
MKLEVRKHCPDILIGNLFNDRVEELRPLYRTQSRYGAKKARIQLQSFYQRLVAFDPIKPQDIVMPRR